MFIHLVLMLFGAQGAVYQPPMYNPICYPGSTTCRALPPVTPVLRPVSKAMPRRFQ